MTNSAKLDDEIFSTVVKNTPLVSIDLVIESKEGEVLLGRRKNEPARDYWFAYGGRILKDERMADAIQRITQTELRRALVQEDGIFLGVYEHLYDENYFEDDSFGTHYVVLAYKFTLSEELSVIPDSQHHDHRWWTVPDLMGAPEVHPNTKAYFAQ
jgi:colanic acid biosynthesis protein WcaH